MRDAVRFRDTDPFMRARFVPLMGGSTDGCHEMLVPAGNNSGECRQVELLKKSKSRFLRLAPTNVAGR